VKRFWILALYNVLLPVVLIVGFPKFLIKGIRRGGVARNFRQRLGLYTAAQKGHFKNGPNLWIHAVSVGEVRVALKVAAQLRRRRPRHKIIISTTTPTGFGLVEKEAPEGVAPIYNPIDLPWVVGRAMRQIRPERLVLVEAEVWPNLVNYARKQGVPVTLINARLSERSERRYRKFSALAAPIFSMLRRVGVQFEEDKPRMSALGIDQQRIEVTGSVKFDPSDEVVPEKKIAELRVLLRDLGVSEGRPVLLAACTHSGEEALIGRVFVSLKEQFSNLFYLVVPRHAERGAQVLADLEKLGLRAVRKSQIDSPEAAGKDGMPEGENTAVDALIADTTGELVAWYHHADVAVIGKSLLGRGGQNPVEAIAAGRPVITGPHMQNFTAITADLQRLDGIEMLRESAAEGREEIDDYANQLEAVLHRILSDGGAANKLAGRGIAALDRHRGATTRTAEMILSVEAVDTENAQG
jgi:3-deoxy-D-manno-octulosonic-acid transferase